MNIPGLGILRSLMGAIAEPICRQIVGPHNGPPTSTRPPSTRLRYVDYGALMTPPAPFRSLNTALHGFWAEADSGRIEALCKRVFNEPSNGAVQCEPLSGSVMITWGSIERVVSATPPYDQRGGVAEPQVAIWVPVALRDPTSPDWRLAMFIPYIWLDNAMSLATGRELFGYPKSWGWPGFPADAGPQVWTLDAFGLDYGPDKLAARHPLLEVAQRGDAASAASAELTSLADLAQDAARRLFDQPPRIGSLELGASLLADVLGDRIPNVFLKQFRDVQDGLGASLQQVVEADYTIVRLTASPLLLEHELTVHHLDSHPVTDELGLSNQMLKLGYKLEMDFNVGNGRVLWDATGP